MTTRETVATKVSTLTILALFFTASLELGADIFSSSQELVLVRVVSALASTPTRASSNELCDALRDAQLSSLVLATV
jgi:hypothetical protein